MKKQFEKNTFNYKKREYMIIAFGICQLVNFVILCILSYSKLAIFGVFCACQSTISAIRDNYCIRRYDPLTTQILLLGASYINIMIDISPILMLLFLVLEVLICLAGYRMLKTKNSHPPK